MVQPADRSRSGRTRRDLALSERDLANATAIALDTELQSTRDELAAAEALLAGTSSDEDASDLQAEVERLTAEVERLEAENASLKTDTTTTTVAPATEPAPATTAPATTAPATTTTTTTEPAPETSAPTGPVDAPSALEIGTWLSGLYRDSVLGDGQQQCLGESVLDALGGDRLAVLLAAVEDPGDEADLIEAVRDAAATCGIDPSAIFG